MSKATTFTVPTVSTQTPFLRKYESKPPRENKAFYDLSILLRKSDSDASYIAPSASHIGTMMVFKHQGCSKKLPRPWNAFGKHTSEFH